MNDPERDPESDTLQGGFFPTQLGKLGPVDAGHDPLDLGGWHSMRAVDHGGLPGSTDESAVVEPRRAALIPLRPWVPTTTKLLPRSSAKSSTNRARDYGVPAMRFLTSSL